MHKFIFIFTILLFVIGCSNDEPKQNVSETPQQQTFEKVTPAVLNQAAKKKVVDHSSKQKSLENQKLVPAENLNTELNKIKAPRTISRTDAAGKPFEMSIADAKNQGTKLGAAYCNCLKAQKDKLRCNGIPLGVERLGKRYGQETGDVIMEAFKVASKGC